MKKFVFFVVLGLALLFFPLSQVYSLEIWERPLVEIEGRLFTEIYECEFTECDLHEEEYSYHLRASDGTVYTLFIGPKWWRQENVIHDSIRDGRYYKLLGFEVRMGGEESRFHVFELSVYNESMLLRDTTEPPPWGRHIEIEEIRYERDEFGDIDLL